MAIAVAVVLASRGWQVTVACEEPGRGPVRTEGWRGVRLLRVPVLAPGALGALPRAVGGGAPQAVKIPARAFTPPRADS